MSTSPIPINQSDPAFAGVKGFKKITNSADRKLKIAIIGKIKSGKSWFAATAPGPIAFYDFDGRADSLEDKDVPVKTLVDVSQTSPTAMKELEGDLATFKYAALQGKPIPKTFVFDSVTYMKKAMENELISQEPTLARSIKLTIGKSLKIPSGWDAINAVRGYCDYIFNEFSQLGNVIFVFHQRDEKDRDKSTKTETAYTGRQTVDPQFLETILALFNEQFFIEVDPYSQKYTVTCRPTSDYGASTTLLIGASEPPNIMDMLKKHKRELEKRAVKDAEQGK
jgi:AAA domain